MLLRVKATSHVQLNFASRAYTVALHKSHRVIKSESKVKAFDSPILVNEFSKYREKYDTPRYPIILCHGFAGFDKLKVVPSFAFNDKTSPDLICIQYWPGIKAALEMIGCTVYMGRVPAFGIIQERATVLKDFIEHQCAQLQRHEPEHSIHNIDTSRTKQENFSETVEKQIGQPIKINLISHSMGGLDCRYMIWKMWHEYLWSNFEVASVTTISTPHRGSEFADFLGMHAGESAFVKSIMPASIFEMTTENMSKFNAKIINDPSVQYFSYGARFTPKWFNLFNFTSRIMNREIRQQLTKLDTNWSEHKKLSLDNDGLVSVKSAHWGEYLGTLDAVDHLDLINWTNRMKTAVDKVIFQQEPKFNAIAFYLDIADKLAKRGF